MFFFKKKDTAEKTKEDRDLIKENADAVEALIILASDNEEFVRKLKAVQEKLRYLSASADSKILDYDKAIKNKLGDLRILLTKNEGEIAKKENNLVLEIELMIVDRNQKI